MYIQIFGEGAEEKQGVRKVIYRSDTKYAGQKGMSFIMPRRNGCLSGTCLLHCTSWRIQARVQKYSTQDCF